MPNTSPAKYYALPAIPSRRVFALCAVIAALLLPLAGVGAPSAQAISRNSVLARAQAWVDAPVHYSQKKRHLGYRTDCSGYVSMCWKTGTSWSTRSLHTVSRRIPTRELRPGDAMLKKGYHVRLFYGWLDEARTQYVAYESGSGLVAVCRIHSLREDLDFGYVPTRLNRISGSPASRNVLRNGSFDSWARSWGVQPEQPVWWQTSTPLWQAVTVSHRTNTSRSSHSSLTLRNPAADPLAYTDLSQSTPVLPGVDYRLTAWAKSSFDPNRVELKLVYLDAFGTALAETSTTGGDAHINGSSFREMSVTAPTPPEAVRALVTVRLAGGVCTSTVGAVITGSTVTLDDISLVRP